MNRRTERHRASVTATPWLAGVVNIVAVMLVTLVGLFVIARPLLAQTTPRIDTRIGYLLTGGNTFSDRPLVQVGGALEFGQTRVGGPPVFGVTAGLVAEFGNVFAASMTTSWRFLAGVEAAWALTDGVDGAAPRAEFVPSIQVGYMTTGGQDERSGLTVRAGPGLRVPLAPDGRMLLTFEPVSIVLLPAPDGVIEDEARVAWELGILKFGFRF